MHTAMLAPSATQFGAEECFRFQHQNCYRDFRAWWMRALKRRMISTNVGALRFVVRVHAQREKQSCKLRLHLLPEWFVRFFFAQGTDETGIMCQDSWCRAASQSLALAYSGRHEALLPGRVHQGWIPVRSTRVVPNKCAEDFDLCSILQSTRGQHPMLPAIHKKGTAAAATLGRWD